MKSIVHKSIDRGSANHGWLNAKHSFSFGNWYDPSKIHFGALRVLNDDIVAPGTGFGTHPHDNMEIITIPLKGSLKHEDSMGNGSVIQSGEVQVMSAGTGIYHSEKNASLNEEINLFQIWIIPNKRDVSPRYDQIRYDINAMKNRFVQVVSPYTEDEGTWIYQNAWIHLAEVEEGQELNYELKSKGNGVYLMVIEGQVQIDSNALDKRDAIGLTELNSFNILTKRQSMLLLIEVPMI